MDRGEVLGGHEEFLFPCVANYYEEPVIITHGSGSCVTDIDGREYLDLFGGILTVSLGHCQPEVADAIAAQARRLGHTSTLYPTENLVRVAQRLARLTPGKLRKSFFTNSGTEANETAVLLAKIHTGRQEILALRNGYSGRSMLTIELTGQDCWHHTPSQLSNVKHAPTPYCYRCPIGLEYPSCEVRCASELEEIIRTATSGKPAAFIAEPIQGVGGFITPPPEYFQIAVGIVHKYGGLFICDEVQTGFGRTGGKWFGIEHWGVEPDVMTFAKGIANGMPVGATIATDTVAASFTGPSISTFGGNPVSMAAVQATLDVMERRDVPALASERGTQMRDALELARERYGFIGDVRGMGLMQAIELVEDRTSKTPAPERTIRLMETAKRHGLLLGKGGQHGNVIRISPPMLISKAELDEALERLGRALADVA